jgi:hypothetical protein
VAFSHGYFRARFARLLAGSMAASIFCIIAWLRLQNGCHCGTIGQKASARGHHTRSIECQRRFRLLERLNLRTALAGGGSMFYAPTAPGAALLFFLHSSGFRDEVGKSCDEITFFAQDFASLAHDMTFFSQHLLTLETRCRSSLRICELSKRTERWRHQ